MIQNVPGIKTFGGHCTCPSGKTYSAGNYSSECDHSACSNGIAGECNYYPGEWSGEKVECFTDVTKYIQNAAQDKNFFLEGTSHNLGGKIAIEFSQMIIKLDARQIWFTARMTKSEKMSELTKVTSDLIFFHDSTVC